MTDFDNETTVEMAQVCPKMSFSEVLRALILFGLLFGMVALASIPQGTLPALVLLHTDEKPSLCPAKNRDASPTVNLAANEQTPPGRFVMGSQTQAQAIQATVALAPVTQSALSHLENHPRLDDNSGPATAAPIRETLEDKRSFGMCLHHEATPSPSIQSVQPLDGVTSSGFTSWDYQATSEAGGGQRAYTMVSLSATLESFGSVETMSPGLSVSLPPYRGEEPGLRDWAFRFEKLGAVRYRLETWGNRGELYRFWCEMPVGQSSWTVRFFEAVASRPEEAMENVLRQVEQWLQDASPVPR